jgi:aminopeptidase N
VNVPTEYTYGTTVYDKGATVVHTMMNYLGQDVFFPAVRAYLNQFAYQDASTYDLRDFLVPFRV